MCIIACFQPQCPCGFRKEIRSFSICFIYIYNIYPIVGHVSVQNASKCHPWDIQERLFFRNWLKVCNQTERPLLLAKVRVVLMYGRGGTVSFFDRLFQQDDLPWKWLNGYPATIGLKIVFLSGPTLLSMRKDIGKSWKSMTVFNPWLAVVILKVVYFHLHFDFDQYGYVLYRLKQPPTGSQRFYSLLLSFLS